MKHHRFYKLVALGITTIFNCQASLHKHVCPGIQAIWQTRNFVADQLVKEGWCIYQDDAIHTMHVWYCSQKKKKDVYIIKKNGSRIVELYKVPAILVLQAGLNHRAEDAMVD